MYFKDMHILSMKDFSKEMIDHILETAEKLEPIAVMKERSDMLAGKVLAVLFFEPAPGHACLLRPLC
jgi:aspartate carbamoyltransferase catalytic subunit